MGADQVAIRVRPGCAEDLPQVAGIYSTGIAERVATFETAAGRRTDGRFSERSVYAAIGEHAVYVDPTARGLGVGRTLLLELFRAAEQAGLHKLTSRIFTSNCQMLWIWQ